jgi:hypothetical protein
MPRTSYVRIDIDTEEAEDDASRTHNDALEHIVTTLRCRMIKTLTTRY